MAPSSNRLQALIRIAIASTSLALSSCSAAADFNTADISKSSSQHRLLVSAAASLVDALHAIDPLFEQSHPGIRVDYNFAASGTLQRQIEQGAPADVFISAALEPMDRLEQAGAIAPVSRCNAIANTLVSIVPRDSELKLSAFGHLVRPDVRKIGVGEFRTVPAGAYAAEVLATEGLLEHLNDRLVFARSARGVLAAVENGHVDAGIVYATDAAASDRVRVVAAAPERAHSPIVYPIAALAESPNLDVARTYIEFLLDERAQRMFRTFGFDPVAPARVP